MIKFDLEGHEFITLNNLLKVTNLVATGGEANQCIENGDVYVNGIEETQKRKKLRINDKVVFRGNTVVIV